MPYKILFFAFLSMFCITGLASLPVFAADEDVYDCRVDSDCVFVGNACIAGAVNKRYESKVNQMALELAQDMDCDYKASYKKYGAFCSYARVECVNPQDRNKGKKCYDRAGQCKIKYE